MADAKRIEDLKKKAQSLRISIIEMLAAAGTGHPGGSLSAVEIITALYFSELRHDPANPRWEERDRFILSKGHAVPALYAAMAETGYFPKEELATLRRTGARLQGHPDRRRLPGIEASTGSLGQGLSVALGVALAARLAPQPWQTYCLMGDGEVQEGQVWEAAMAAAQYKLGGLTAILDANGGQIDGPIAEVMNIEPIADKWRAFNWDVLVIDGHRLEEVLPALRHANRAEIHNGKPRMIIARTVKGKGVSFLEHPTQWHGAVPDKELTAKALDELRRNPV